MLTDTLARPEGGAGAVATSSGLAAIDLVLARLGPDDFLVAPYDCYGSAYRFLAARTVSRQINVVLVDEGTVAVALAREDAPRLVYIKAPSNSFWPISTGT